MVDVAVENSLYGEIRATLNLCNRYDVDNFIRQAADAPESLLSRMTGGVHLHTCLLYTSLPPAPARFSPQRKRGAL